MPVKKCNKIQCFVCYSLFQYSREIIIQWINIIQWIIIIHSLVY